MPGSGGVRCTWTAGDPGLEVARESWQRVLGAMRAPQFYHSFEWHLAARALDPQPDDAYVGILWAGERPRAILPMRRRRQRVAGVELRLLEAPRHPHLPLCDVITDDAAFFGQHLGCCLDQLWREHAVPCDALLFPRVPEHADLTHAIRAWPSARIAVEKTEACDLLPVGGYEMRQESFSRNFRAALRKARNKLDAEAAVEWVTAAAPPAIDLAFAQFVEVEASGWKGAAGSAIGSDAALTSFYRGLVREMAPRGACEIDLLRVGGQAIAGQFALVCGDTRYLLKIGFRESHARLAPGNMLLERLLLRLQCGGGAQCVNLLTEAPWHASWKPQQLPTHRYFLLRDTPRGRIVSLLLGIKRRLRPIYRALRPRPPSRSARCAQDPGPISHTSPPPASSSTDQ